MLEETEELLVAVPVLAEPAHLPSDDLQRSEQGGGDMADVVMAASLVVTRLHRKHFLGAVQRLELGLLIDTQHDRVNRRYRYRPTVSVTLASNSRSMENVNVSTFHGQTPYFFQALVTVYLVHPQAGGQQHDPRPLRCPLLLRCSNAPPSQVSLGHRHEAAGPGLVYSPCPITPPNRKAI